jgi:hypothetical protein
MMSHCWYLMDMSLGSRFIFEQAQFDLMCSDLSGIHLAQSTL